MTTLIDWGVLLNFFDFSAHRSGSSLREYLRPLDPPLQGVYHVHAVQNKNVGYCRSFNKIFYICCKYSQKRILYSLQIHKKNFCGGLAEALPPCTPFAVIAFLVQKPISENFCRLTPRGNWMNNQDMLLATQYKELMGS